MPAGFRDEQLLLIAPGSQTTLAQLGLPEYVTTRWADTQANKKTEASAPADGAFQR